ncbi:hypothetical protein D3C81_954060 [compost metagenome]
MLQSSGRLHKLKLISHFVTAVVQRVCFADDLAPTQIDRQLFEYHVIRSTRAIAVLINFI